ncbi:MAG: FtsX-like permease family protein [Gemmataceae bacterium]
MKLRRLLWHNLFFHWRGNLAVLLGVVVGTAVLTGALLVGDSLRGSLRDLTQRQLGWIEQTLITGRFFTSDLADQLTAQGGTQAILLQGTVTTATYDDKGMPWHSLGKVTILGVEPSFWPADTARPDATFWNAGKPEILLSPTVADELHVQAGDQVIIYVQKASSVPRESLLGHKSTDEVVFRLPLTVRAVLPADNFGSRFNLSPSPAPPRNVFVPLGVLQEELELAGKVNAVLTPATEKNLQEELNRALTLDDWGLVLHDADERTQALFAKLDRNDDGQLSRLEWRNRVPQAIADLAEPQTGVIAKAAVAEHYRQRGYLSLESRNMLLEPAVVRAARQAAADTQLRTAPTLVYLANTISDGKNEIPYSVVAALDPTQAPPLGPFLPPGVKSLADDDIVLVDWPDSPLQAKPGDAITLTYFLPNAQGGLVEKSTAFRLKGFLPLEGPVHDPDLTPEFPGITDKLTLRDWNPPFEYKAERVKDRDEEYWNIYRTTPKAYVNLATGQRLWGSRFGNLTSIRLAPQTNASPPYPDLPQKAAEFRQSLLHHLQAEDGGFVVEKVRERSLEASAGSMDFGLLFLGFSFFVILAAKLLVGLLFRLNIDRRASEIGLLYAIGYRRRTVWRLLLAEGAVLALLGGVAGLVGAVGYAWLLLDTLAAWWPGALDRSLLRLHVTPFSLVLGYGLALLVSLIAMIWSMRVINRAAPTALLAGETTPSRDPRGPRRPRVSVWITGVTLILGLALLISAGLLRDQEMRAFTFFSGGALLLTAALAGTWAWMHRSKHALIHGQGATALTRLGVRNAARHPLRSLLTAGLLASAAFLVVAVESFRREPDKDFHEKEAGSGGFPLLAEADVPIFLNLNDANARFDLGFSDTSEAILKDVRFFALRRQPGDDASCLNLYQPQRPQILGVPPALIDRGGFQFAATLAQADEEKANPWRLLDQPSQEGTIPVFGEQHSVGWVLKKGLGDTFDITNERGEKVKVRIAGLLKDSVFQNGLLMSEANFLRLYPGQEGYRFFLIDAPLEKADVVKGELQHQLATYGFEVTPSAQRLALFLEVENTYLSTFQALGGLGLLLGALGLAVVLLRAVWERRGELALLRALGYRPRALEWLILAENGFLLLLGLALGTLAALLSVAPQVLSGEGRIPWLGVVMLVVLVTSIGLSAGAAAVSFTLRAPLLAALRKE